VEPLLPVAPPKQVQPLGAGLISLLASSATGAVVGQVVVATVDLE
jgi:hypothetical protein